MNGTLVFWTVLFLLVNCTLLLLPFYPAWQEWRRPVDAVRLEIPEAPASTRDPVSPEERLTPASHSPDSVIASARILAPSGSRFHSLCAPTILLGMAEASSHPPPRIGHRPQIRPERAKRWGAEGWRVEGDCRIPDAHQVHGALVVTGVLHIGKDCVIRGDIKAHGPVHIGQRSQLLGALFGEQAITLQAGVEALGPVVSETSVSVGPGVQIGNLQHPGMLIAPEIEVHAGAVVHGKVWAKTRGRVT